ncbi:MAG: type I-C CRISPR-associated protein Cas8c/Csd1 [Oscillospiraceae bacterium]|nr:type I-C CRISPR-associated protein Cas8c/Csd1 [Oscillospiraceae bacterium]
MILQALYQHYDTLCRQGKLSPPGWDAAFKVSFGLELSQDGELLDLLDLRATQLRGKKEILVPKLINVPAHKGRTVGISANFLCDNATYLLGVDEKGKPERAKQCFQACATLHHQLLDGVDSPAAKAILAFFDHWEPNKAAEHPCLASQWKDLMGNANLLFFYDLNEVIEDPAIRNAWQTYYDAVNPEAVQSQCLITGEIGPIAATHPPIKGVRGAQSSGAALVSFNASAFCSYGHEQNLNAPVSERAAFAYTAALNALLADQEHCRVIGDTTVVCWAEHGEAIYQNTAFAAMFGSDDGISDEDLSALLNKLVQGKWIDWDAYHLNPEEHFFFLGLAPNAARLSVRFFLRDSFGNFMKNIAKHYADTAILRPSYDKFEHLPLWKLLNETVNQNAQNKSPSPQLAGDTLRAILAGTPYPATLLYGANLRIRADCQVTRGRAAIIKGYYLRNPNIPFPREVLTMEGNPNSTSVPYTLGRLFSVLEQIQEAANPGLNATIKDKYFNSASATPAPIFTLLVNLAQKHLRVIRRTKPGMAVNFEKKIAEYAALIGESYPTRLTLPEQGAFQLGYYFETQNRYSKKTTNEIKED